MVGAHGRKRTGKEQSRKLGQYWRKNGVVFDYVFASEAVRAAETAKISCEEAGITAPIVCCPEIVEIHRGQWEGQPAHQVFTGKALDTFLDDPYNFRAPNGESEGEVEERMHAFFNSTLLPLLQSFCDEKSRQVKGEEDAEGHQGSKEKKKSMLHVAIFSHGVSLRCFLRRVLNADSKAFRMEMYNTGISELEIHGTQWRARTLNSTVHLH